MSQAGLYKALRKNVGEFSESYCRLYESRQRLQEALALALEGHDGVAVNSILHDGDLEDIQLTIPGLGDPGAEI
jgi:hypothetical protein